MEERKILERRLVERIDIKGKYAGEFRENLIVSDLVGRGQAAYAYPRKWILIQQPRPGIFPTSSNFQPI